jgi:hypothetical protein
MVREEIKGEGRRISCLALLFVDRFVLFSGGKHMEKIDSFVSQSMLKRVHGPLFRDTCQMVSRLPYNMFKFLILKYIFPIVRSFLIHSVKGNLQRL